jgi:hypothetical protein
MEKGKARNDPVKLLSNGSRMALVKGNGDETSVAREQRNPRLTAHLIPHDEAVRTTGTDTHRQSMLPSRLKLIHRCKANEGF